MTDLFKKLNFKDQAAVVLLQAPDTFAPQAEAMSAYCEIRQALQDPKTDAFVLAFATKQAEVDAFAQDFAQKTEGDAILWIAYPKGSSKRFRCDFNRDTGWKCLGELGFEPVRQVAIDEDWSALRFRRVDFIKTMSRSFALSQEGKEKAAPKVYEMPNDLRRALQAVPAVLEIFNALAPSHRKEYIRWIEEAKKEETRQRRVEQTLEKLQKK